MENTTSNAQFKGKDSHIQNDRIKFQKNNGTLSIPLYDSKDKDIGFNPSGYLPFVTPQGIKYIPVYNTNYGSSGSRGPVSKLSSVNGKACNLCFSNCNKNYSNYDDCNAMCDCTCNQCDSCVGCDGCNDCHSCNTDCNGKCYGCQECQSCNSSCNGDCNTGCHGTCYGCHGCVECQSKCNECQGNCWGCHGCYSFCNANQSCSKCHGSCNGCYPGENSCTGCNGTSCVSGSDCTRNDAYCCDNDLGQCDHCDGHCANGTKEPAACYDQTCTSQGTHEPCGNSKCSNYTCHDCHNCNSCQSCNSRCNGTCNGGCVGCQGCNSCYDKCNNPSGGCNSCNSCNSCQTCVECQTCVGCQSCNSECYEENADYNRTCETWYAGSRRALNK